MQTHTYIEITQEFINNGENLSAIKCPVAKAIKATVPCASVAVSDDYVRIDDPDSHPRIVRFASSPDLRRWIALYDICAKDVKPIKIRLTKDLNGSFWGNTATIVKELAV